MVDPLIALGTAVLIIIILAILLWPERGLISRWQQTSHLNERVRSEDALKHIHKFEMEGRRPTLESIAGALHASCKPKTVKSTSLSKVVIRPYTSSAPIACGNATWPKKPACTRLNGTTRPNWPNIDSRRNKPTRWPCS